MSGCFQVAGGLWYQYDHEVEHVAFLDCEQDGEALFECDAPSVGQTEMTDDRQVVVGRPGTSFRKCTYVCRFWKRSGMGCSSSSRRRTGRSFFILRDLYFALTSIMWPMLVWLRWPVLQAMNNRLWNAMSEAKLIPFIFFSHRMLKWRSRIFGSDTILGHPSEHELAPHLAFLR